MKTQLARLRCWFETKHPQIKQTQDMNTKESHQWKNGIWKRIESVEMSILPEFTEGKKHKHSVFGMSKENGNLLQQIS